MAKLRSVSLLAYIIILLSSGICCSHQTRSTETLRGSSDHNEDLVFQASPRKGIILEHTTMPIDREVTAESIPKCPGYQSDTKNINNYQVFVFGIWVSRKCHFDLIWNQRKCQCDWKPGIITKLEEARQSKCDLTLNITFDGYAVRDYSKNTFIRVDPPVAIVSNTGDGRSVVKSGHFDPGRLTLHFFAGNSYSDSFQLGVNFKQEEGKASNSSHEVTLITNACEISPNATIAVRINSKRQELSFIVNDHVENANLIKTTHQWHSLAVSFVKGAVLITDNDQQILNSTAYPAFVDQSQCPLSIGGDPTDAANNFHGYIDSILLWRHCPADPKRNVHHKIE